MMMEDPIFIQRDISHFGAMLKLYMCDECRANLERLLAEAAEVGDGGCFGSAAALTKSPVPSSWRARSQRGHHLFSTTAQRKEPPLVGAAHCYA